MGISWSRLGRGSKCSHTCLPGAPGHPLATGTRGPSLSLGSGPWGLRLSGCLAGGTRALRTLTFQEGHWVFFSFLIAQQDHVDSCSMPGASRCILLCHLPSGVALAPPVLPDTTPTLACTLPSHQQFRSLNVGSPLWPLPGSSGVWLAGGQPRTTGRCLSEGEVQHQMLLPLETPKHVHPVARTPDVAARPGADTLLSNNECTKPTP